MVNNRVNLCKPSAQNLNTLAYPCLNNPDNYCNVSSPYMCGAAYQALHNTAIQHSKVYYIHLYKGLQFI